MLCKEQPQPRDHKDPVDHLHLFYCKEATYLFAGAAALDDSPALLQQLAAAYTGLADVLGGPNSSEGARYCNRALALAGWSALASEDVEVVGNCRPNPPEEVAEGSAQ
jgi:hypothetical protein